MPLFKPKTPHRSRQTRWLLAATALGAAATAAWVQVQARRARREHPPTGHFLRVDGVRLHYVVRGEGPTVVLLHGNVVTLRDFEACGLLDELAIHHRVIAFDRPGFGHSSRPRDRLWTPQAQADVLAQALHHLGVEGAFVVGHSMGAMVATALAVHHPIRVRGLALLGGYYYPSMRVDALLVAPVALPVVGDVMRYTVSALSARALLGKMTQAMFAPCAVPEVFSALVPREMMLRPGQLRADAEDGTFLVPAAAAAKDHYGALSRIPVLLVAGGEDRIIDPEAHSGRLHQELPHSAYVVVPGAGHMVHYDRKARARVVEAAKKVLPDTAEHPEQPQAPAYTP